MPSWVPARALLCGGVSVAGTHPFCISCIDGKTVWESVSVPIAILGSLPPPRRAPQADFLSASAADIRHLQELWNLAQPDQFGQNGLNQVQRFSLTNQGPAVAIGETVNSDPAAWVHNCGPSGSCPGGAANNLSKAVFAQYGQAGYSADPSKYSAPTPGMQVRPRACFPASVPLFLCEPRPTLAVRILMFPICLSPSPSPLPCRAPGRLRTGLVRCQHNGDHVCHARAHFGPAFCASIRSAIFGPV